MAGETAPTIHKALYPRHNNSIIDENSTAGIEDELCILNTIKLRRY